MKTLCLTSSISRKAGGLFQSVRRLHQELSRLDGINVRVIGGQDEFTAEDIPQWVPLRVQALPVCGPCSFGFTPGLKVALDRGQYDLLHVHGLWQYPSWSALSWHHQTDRPHIISPRGMLDQWALKNSRWKKLVAGWLFENEHLCQAACIHALCEAEAQSIRDYGLKNPIAIIPNGIDIPEVRSQKSEVSPAPWTNYIEPGRKVLLFLSRIHPKKGLVNLLRAWAAVQKAVVGGPVVSGLGSDWVLALAGWDQGGHEAELKSLATELGIPWSDVRGNGKSDPSSIFNPQSSLLFLGPQFGDSKAACYANGDAFILPSFSEGLPMAILEAWAYGKTVLMTPECNLPEGFAANAAIRIETNPESITAGLTELFRAANTSPLRLDQGSSPMGMGEDGRRSGEGRQGKTKICGEGQGEVSNLSAPRSALHALGANGRALVAGKFAWPKIAQDMKLVYEWVLGGGPKPGCVV